MNGGSGEVVIAIVLKETAPGVHPANPRPPDVCFVFFLDPDQSVSKSTAC
jgi:hypothetical protein